MSRRNLLEVKPSDAVMSTDPEVRKGCSPLVWNSTVTHPAFAKGPVTRYGKLAFRCANRGMSDSTEFLAAASSSRGSSIFRSSTRVQRSCMYESLRWRREECIRRKEFGYLSRSRRVIRLVSLEFVFFFLLPLNRLSYRSKKIYWGWINCVWIAELLWRMI